MKCYEFVDEMIRPGITLNAFVGAHLVRLGATSGQQGFGRPVIVSNSSAPIMETRRHGPKEEILVTHAEVAKAEGHVFLRRPIDPADSSIIVRAKCDIGKKVADKLILGGIARQGSGVRIVASGITSHSTPYFKDYLLVVPDTQWVVITIVSQERGRMLFSLRNTGGELVEST